MFIHTEEAFQMLVVKKIFFNKLDGQLFLRMDKIFQNCRLFLGRGGGALYV